MCGDEMQKKPAEKTGKKTVTAAFGNFTSMDPDLAWGGKRGSEVLFRGLSNRRALGKAGGLRKCWGEGDKYCKQMS